MTDTQIFHPNDKPLNIKLLWFSALILPIVIPSARLEFTSQYLIPEAILSLLLVLIFVLPARVPESITVSVKDHLLTYCYYNCWGIKRTVSLDADHALARYSDTSLARIDHRYRLSLYSGNGRHRRVTIVQDNKGGFTREQLDEITHLLEECGTDCHLCMRLKASA